MTLRSLHLFAGAGGGLLADLLLGHRPTVAVEIEPYCRQILEARRREGWFPDLEEIHDDVTTFHGSRWQGRIDLVAGGFPCQDISVAGKGRGLSGQRSGLFFELIRVVREVRPRYVFLENSPAITVRGLDRVLGELAALGFDAEWCCLPASAVGAPHRRDRWWLLARDRNAHGDQSSAVASVPQGTHADAGRDGPAVADAASGQGVGRGSRVLGEEERGREGIDADERLGDGADRALRAGRAPVDGGGQGHDPDADRGRCEVERLKEHGGQQRASGREPDGLRAAGRRDGTAGSADTDAAPQPRLGGAPDGLARWLDRSAAYWAGDWEHGVPRVTDRRANRVSRLTALGNGQVPQCAAAAFLTLMQRLEQP